MKLIYIAGILALVGCQSQPTNKANEKPLEAKNAPIKTSTGVIIQPYDREEIQRKKVD
jgi:uncharacterized lipoprotein YajG